MIENYLDFVKRKRARAIEAARRSLYDSRNARDEWHQGFRSGLKLAYEFASRDWRTLQKSLEDHIEHACTHSSPEVWEKFSRSLLS